jgi:hypothetical protein
VVGERTPHGIQGIETRELVDHAVKLASSPQEL